MPAVAVKESGPEHIIILGAGIGGLSTALVLAGTGKRVTIFERDPAPPEIEPSAAFDDWKRPGVPQLRHTHIFLARVHSILRRHHPQLLQELAQAGVMSGSLDQLLPAAHVEHYQSSPADRDLLHLWGRRATFEYVLRRHVARLGDVSFVHDANVERLLIERVGRQLRVTGVEVRRGGSSERVMADVLVDSSGRRSQAIEWLREQGAAIRAESRASQCAYYCRHYVQCSSAPEPPRRGTGASLDYLVFGTFFADAGTFSIALTSPEFETELLGRLRRPEGFDAVCRQIPALRVWLERSEPISRVLGGADLVNRWQHFPRFGKQPVLGFFPVGDAYMQTNPIYGRGCSSAFVQAHALGEALLRQREPGARATYYHRSVWRLLRPHFDFCVAADRGFLARARQVRGETLPWRERMVSQAYESAFLPALEESSWVAREWLRAQQMCEIASPWVAVQLLVYLCFRWALRGRSAPAKLPGQVGPERGDMLASFD